MEGSRQISLETLEYSFSDTVCFPSLYNTFVNVSQRGFTNTPVPLYSLLWWWSMAVWKDTPSMTSVKYISQALFSSNSNLGYSGFALWLEQVLHSPEIAIAHLSRGLRSSYQRERASFKFLSLQYAWQSWCPLNIEVWGALVLFCLQAQRQTQRTCKLPSNILSQDGYLPALADSPTSADPHCLQIILLSMFTPVWPGNSLLLKEDGWRQRLSRVWLLAKSLKVHQVTTE